MMLIATDYSEIRKFLNAYLESCSKKNPHFSMRALAKSWSITPSMLSQVLNGKRNFSKKQGALIISKLKLNKVESDHLALLFDLASTEDAFSDRRDQIYNQIKINSLSNQRKQIELEQFNLISAWYCIPIIEICSMRGFKGSAENIAKMLRITEEQVTATLASLEKLGILVRTKEGTYNRNAPFFKVTSENKNVALRSFHAAMMQKAITAFETQTNEERCVGTETFVFSKRHMDEARAAIVLCFNTLLVLSEKSKNYDDLDLYHIGMQFFRLAHVTPQKEIS